MDGEWVEETVADRPISYWYGYSITHHYYEGAQPPENIDISPTFEAVVWNNNYGHEESYKNIGGYEWQVSTTYTATFDTYEEAEAAGEAFIDEMHWKREAEQFGIGEELVKQAAIQVAKEADYLRTLDKQGDKEGLLRRFVELHLLEKLRQALQVRIDGKSTTEA